MTNEQLLFGLVWYIVFLVSLTFHEAAHAWAARLLGDPTAYYGGQVTLNPLPHMQREPFGMVLVPLLTAVTRGFPIGWASAPYDPLWEQRHPRRAAWMAAAGPAANLALALFAFAALKLGLAAGVFEMPQELFASRLVVADELFVANIGRFLSMLLALNVALGLLNLMPVPPLDGLAVLGLVLPGDAGLRLQQALRTPLAAIAGLLAVWMLFPKLFRPLFWEIAGLLYCGTA
jgi:Zn-dependent protease